MSSTLSRLPQHKVNIAALLYPNQLCVCRCISRYAYANVSVCVYVFVRAHKEIMLH